MSPKNIPCLAMLALLLPASAAKAEKVPFDSDRWKFSAEAHEIVQYMGRQALYLKGGHAYVDDLQITNGVIEFDIAIGRQRGFSGAIWRMTDSDNFEEFYLRHHQSGNPDANQYTPIFNASAAWQLYHGEGYSSPTVYRFDEWMHVKIEIADSRGRVYIDSEEPSVIITDLKHAVGPGKLGVMSSYAPAHFSNFTASSTTPEWSAERKASEPPFRAGIVRQWLVSDPFANAELDEVVDMRRELIEGRVWRLLDAEANGVANLAEVAGLQGHRDTVFARAIVESEAPQKVRLRFGFSDNARLYVNNRLIYEGTNTYRSRDYRYLGTIGLFDAIHVDLRPGTNEILFAVQENFGGWGVVAELPSDAVVKQVTAQRVDQSPATEHAALSTALESLISRRASEEGFTGSVLVSRGGKTVLHRTYGPEASFAGEVEPAYWIASGSKQFTGAAVASLASEGKLGLDTSIDRYLDDVPADKRRITIRQLLTHTSGLDHRYAAEGIRDRESAARAILQVDLVSPSGSRYSYSNDGFSLLAIIAEITADQTYEQLMQSRVFGPAGMIHTGLWGFEGSQRIAPAQAAKRLTRQSRKIYREGRSQANWGYRGATGVFSTTQDLHRWLTRLITKSSDRDDALSQVVSAEQFIREAPDMGTVYYGFGIAVVQRGGVLVMISHLGDEDWLGHNSSLAAYADGDVIVVLSNSGYLDDGTSWSAAVTRDIRELLEK